MSNQLSTKHLLGIEPLSADDINLILNTAQSFKEIINRPIKKVPSLRDITIANLFFENSTRTRMSFELAEKRLSADVINFSASSSSVNKGETLLDTVNNILSMKVDIIVMRHPSPGAHAYISKHIDAQVVNAGDGTHEHPTQALLDAFSMQEKVGGAEVEVFGPPTLIPIHLDKLGVRVSHDIQKTLAWCDIANVLRIQLERQKDQYFPSLREYTLHYGVNLERLNRLDKEIVIMHPGPINRGVELSSDVADSEHSIILEQVQNGVAVRMAILYLLAGQREPAQ